MELPNDTEYTNEELNEIIILNYGKPTNFISGIIKEKGKKIGYLLNCFG